MPKLTRRFPTTQKTTTEEGNREYRRLQQKDFRERKKAEDIEKDKYILNLQKTINLMRIEHYPDLPLINIGKIPNE